MHDSECMCVCVRFFFYYFALSSAYGIYGVVNLVAPLLLDASCLIDSNRENTIIQRYDVSAATIFKCAHIKWKEKRERMREKNNVLNDNFYDCSHNNEKNKLSGQLNILIRMLT